MVGKELTVEITDKDVVVIYPEISGDMLYPFRHVTNSTISCGGDLNGSFPSTDTAFVSGGGGSVDFNG